MILNRISEGWQKTTSSRPIFGLTTSDTAAPSYEVDRWIAWDLERFPPGLNRDSPKGQKGRALAGDSVCGGYHGTGLLIGFARARGWRDRGRCHAAGGGEAFGYLRRFCGTLASDVVARWNNRGQALWGGGSVLDDYAEEIVALVEKQRDQTLDEIVTAMHKRRIPGSRTALFRFLERHGITRKKRCCTPANRNARTWPAPVGAGFARKGCLIRPTLSLLTKPR